MQVQPVTKIAAFAQALEGLGPGEFTTQDAHRIALQFGLNPSHAGQMLTRLEKQNKLVRIGHGRYLTMAHYTQQQLPKED